MGLNNLGLGFVFTAKDLASGVMRHVKDSFNEVEGASKAAKAAFGGAMKQFSMGLGMMGAGAAGLAMLAPAVEEATAFSKAIAEVATEANLAVFPQEAMRKVALDMSTQFAQMPVDEVKAMYKAVAMGADTAAKATGILSGANLLAVAGGSNLETTMQAIGGALNAYGADFGQATDYSDIFFTAMKAGNMRVEDLAGSIGRITATAAGLGIPLDQISAAVAVMTNKGVEASEAVSGLRGALAGVVHPTADAEKEAKKLGVTFTQAHLREVGLQNFLHEITGSSKFTADSLSQLFGSVEGGSAILQVTAGNMAMFDANMKSMGDRANATQKGFDIMSQTLDFQNKAFAANVSAAKVMIGSALEPIGVAIMTVVNAAIVAFTKLPKPIVNFFTRLFAGVSVMLVLVGAFIAVKAVIALVGMAMGALGVTIGSLFAAIWPIVLVVGALALAAYGLKAAYDKNIGGIGDKFRAMYDVVALAVKAIGQLFDEGGFSGDVLKDLNKGHQGVKAFAINVYVAFKRIQHFFEMIGEGFDTAMRAAQPTIDAFSGALKKLGEAFGESSVEGPEQSLSTWERFGRAGARVGKAIVWLFEKVMNIVTAVIDIVTGIVEGFRSWNGITDVLMGAFSALGDALANVFDQFYSGNAAAKEGTSIWQVIGDVIGWVVGGIVWAIAIVVAAVTLVIEVISGVIGFVRSLFSGLMDFFMGFGEIIDGLLTGDMGKVWQGFKLMIFGVLDAIVGMVLETVGVIAGAVDALAAVFGKKLGAQEAIQGFKHELHNAMGEGFGVLDVTGKQGITVTHVVAPPAATAGPPVLAKPGETGYSPTIANATMTPPPDPAKDPWGGAAVVNLMLDGDKVGQALVKRNQSDAHRSYSGGSPIPGV
jgi:TP901 family phage tail tape measure protein